jgi:hypothetical protein
MASTPYWQADKSRRPLVVVSLVGADGVQQPDVESLIHIADALVEGHERTVVVWDLTGSKPDTRRRQLLVKWLRENGDKYARSVAASAFVAPTTFHRALLTTTFWFVKPKRPVAIFADRPRALSWAISEGRRAGLSGLMWESSS